jgi:hypothetical protein
MDFEGSGRDRFEVISVFFLDVLRKKQRTSVRIAGILAEIRTQHLMHMNQNPYCYANPPDKRILYFVAFCVSVE